MQLKPGTKLQGGKYEIVRTLGQGGFGITYLAEHVLLKSEVAVKEFFMKDCCERDDATSRVTVGTGSQRVLVEKFRGKFIREAQMMHAMAHPHIVRVTDVFEENGTAYYVMENLPGGSLADRIKKIGPMPESQAENYIRQVSDALAYIHSRNTVHLDVKPSNILLNAKGDAVLIDFGISKHYDDSGEQTSSTPVGISKGYAPLEQGRDGDVSQFKPSTDIYALGATLYTLLTGEVPPDAAALYEEEALLAIPEGISNPVRGAIEKAMSPRRQDRPQSIEAFIAMLNSSTIPSVPVADADPEGTYVLGKKISDPQLTRKPGQNVLQKPKFAAKVPESQSQDNKKPKTWRWISLAGLAIVASSLVIIVPKRLAINADNRTYQACISVNDYRSYISDFGQGALHYDEALRFIETFVADSTKEALLLLEEQKRLEKEARKKKIGDLIVFEGGDKGIVFYVDKSNEHGLVVSLDEGYGPFWNFSSTSVFPKEYCDEYDNFKSVTPGRGAKLTTNIIKALGPDAIAATWARRHGKDWYLPSNGEMFYMLRVSNKWQEEKGPVSQGLVNNGGTSLSSKRHGGYFTSSVSHIDKDNTGWLYRFDEDSMFCTSSDRPKLSYRAVRRF